MRIGGGGGGGGGRRGEGDSCLIGSEKRDFQEKKKAHLSTERERKERNPSSKGNIYTALWVRSQSGRKKIDGVAIPIWRQKGRKEAFLYGWARLGKKEKFIIHLIKGDVRGGGEGKGISQPHTRLREAERRGGSSFILMKMHHQSYDKKFKREREYILVDPFYNSSLGGERGERRDSTNNN